MEGMEATVNYKQIGFEITEDGECIFYVKGELDIPTDPPEEEIAEKLTLKTVIEGLEAPERRLIELRYFKGLTQVKTAKELGMSQVQVSRKEKAILLKMRKMM